MKLVVRFPFTIYTHFVFLPLQHYTHNISGGVIAAAVFGAGGRGKTFFKGARFSESLSWYKMVAAVYL